MKDHVIKFNKILNNKSYNNTIKSISLLHQIKLHKHYLQKKINLQREATNIAYSWNTRSEEWLNFLNKVRQLKN